MRTRIILTVAAAAFAAIALATGALAGSAKKPPKSQATAKLESRALFSVLTGRNEIGANGRRGAGDPDGRGSFTAIVDGGQLCFGVTVTNLDTPTAAHIHAGRRNQNNPPLITLTQPTAGDPGAASGCVPVTTEVAQAILKNPHKYYFNVHTAAYPNGAVRGQLSRKSH